MIETEIKIILNRKEDIEAIKQNIINSNIQFPVYIFEFENNYQIEFVSDYEEWELDNKILECFPKYEFTEDLQNIGKDIRVQLSRKQSELSTDNWGRQIENPINETKYLIKKTNNVNKNFNPKIKILFEGNEKDYYINIIDGINKITKESGFLLLNNFKTKNENTNAEILKDRLYKSPIEAFSSGYIKMRDLVNKDFKEYISQKNKKLSDQQKIPRKIIKDFINSCNKYELEEILKNIDESIIYEKKVHWQTILKIEGVQDFKEYLKSSNQELCMRDFKIRSTWIFNLPNITIRVTFFQNHNENGLTNTIQYLQFKFTLNKTKIISIVEEK